MKNNAPQMSLSAAVDELSGKVPEALLCELDCVYSITCALIENDMTDRLQHMAEEHHNQAAATFLTQIMTLSG